MGVTPTPNIHLTNKRRLSTRPFSIAGGTGRKGQHSALAGACCLLSWGCHGQAPHRRPSSILRTLLPCSSTAGRGDAPISAVWGRGGNHGVSGPASARMEFTRIQLVLKIQSQRPQRPLNHDSGDTEAIVFLEEAPQTQALAKTEGGGAGVKGDRDGGDSLWKGER